MNFKSPVHIFQCTCGVTDSNRRPLACKANALPAALTPHFIFLYFFIHHFAEFGECYCYLYVNSDETLWKEDRQSLEDGYAFAYVYNKDDDFCSEFGSIGIRPQFGGLVRTA